MIAFVKMNTCLVPLVDKRYGVVIATCERDCKHKGKHREVRRGEDYGVRGSVVIAWPSADKKQ